MTTWKHNNTVESEPLCNNQWLLDMYDLLLYEWTFKYLLPQCLLWCYFSHKIHECVFLFFTSVREDESSKMCLYRSQVCKVVISLCLRSMCYKCLWGKTRKKWMWNEFIIFSTFSFILNWKVLFQQKKLMHDHTSMRTDGFRSKPLFGYRYVNILHALYLIIISHDFMASGLW